MSSICQVRLVSNVLRGDVSFTETSSQAQTPQFIRQTFRARRAGCNDPKDCDGNRSSARTGSGEKLTA